MRICGAAGSRSCRFRITSSSTAAPDCRGSSERMGARMSEPTAEPVDPPPASNWSVWRTDDNGNTFLVREKLTHEEAQRLVAEFTARGHKQLYFVERLLPG